YYS
ncbi:Glycerol-3-phosphate transporter, partial [Haemophilus influenzae]